MLTTVLQMIFKNLAGAKYTLELPHPRENLTGAEVAEAMENIILFNALEYKMHPLTEIVGARLVTKEIEYFDLD